MRFLLYGQRLIEKGAWYFAPFSWLYALVILCRNWLYDHRWLPIEKVPCTVVSVGNVVAGGSGKTPFVQLLAQQFPHRRVAILSRGYGPFPDEAVLLSRRLPKAKVYVGKDRVRTAKQAIADGAELIILDDGFQHRRLYRDFDIVLGDDQGYYLPRGFLRDNPRRRGDLRLMPEEMRVKVTGIFDAQGRSVASIAGWHVVLFSGIAKPQKFKKTVLELGAIVVAEAIFADHEPATLSQLPKADAFICTEKDFVKLPHTDLPIY